LCEKGKDYEEEKTSDKGYKNIPLFKDNLLHFYHPQEE
jgi:hypothetical protein